eukprot:jgi/Pico_ML_1/53751/g4243.t1
MRGKATNGVAELQRDVPVPISTTTAWKELQEHVKDVKKLHLRDLIHDEKRVEGMIKEHDGMYVDFSRQCATEETMKLLLDLAETSHLKPKIQAMFEGQHINATEDRAVLHTALRAPRNKSIVVDGRNVTPDVHLVLDQIKDFSEKVRNGEWLGATGKPLKDVVAVGIGGSFLGPLFVHTALRTNPEAALGAQGRQLRFLANVDPVDVARALNGLDPETTMVVVVSKTFTTAETMLNARTVRTWITTELDALACGKSEIELRAESVPDHLIPHKSFTGNRPSTSILLPSLDAYTTGQILSLYEARVAVQGFVWGINSFDQWGVELGKVLASRVRTTMNRARTENKKLASGDGFNPSTTKMINRYLEGKAQLLYPEPKDVFPCDIINSDECRPPTSYV